MKKSNIAKTIIAATLFVAAAGNAAVLKSEDFEVGTSMSLDDNNGASSLIITDPADGGNKVVHLTTATNGVTHNNGNTRLFANEWFDAEALITFSFDVYFKDSLGNGSVDNDGLFVRFGYERVDGWIAPDPVINLVDFQSITNTSQGRGFSPNKWYHVDILANGGANGAVAYDGDDIPGTGARTLDPHEMDIFINGEYVKSSSAKNGASTNLITSVGIETLNAHAGGNRANLYIDNVVIRDEIAVGYVPASTGFSTLNIPPTENIIESYVAFQEASFGPTRKTDTPAVGSDNRVVGQTFTVSGTNTYLMDAVTLLCGSGKTFTSSNQSLAVAILKDTNSDGRGDDLLGSYTYDVTGMTAYGGAYFTFPLGNGISNVTAGTYQIETYYGETDADNFGINWDRNDSTNDYAGGLQVSIGTNTNDFPVGDGLSKAANADLTFFVQARDMAGILPTFGTYSTNGIAPSSNLLEWFEPVSNQSSFTSTRLTDSPTVNSDNRVLGQTFTLSGIAGTATIDAITVLKATTGEELAYTNVQHTYQLALLKDTDSDGKGDEQVGVTYNFDFTGTTFSSNETYVTFDLGAGITGIVDGVYHVEFYWGETDPLNNSFSMHRQVSSNGYVNGGQIAKFQNDGSFPVGDGMGSPSTEADFTFYIQGTEDAPADYDSWADGHSLVGPDRDLDADLEPDGMDNLTEYALGGDPNVADADTYLPSYETDVAGSYIEYVHRERSDAVSRGLEYNVQSTAILTSPAWTNDSTITYVGEGAIDADFDTVTNRLDTASGDYYSIRLRIQQN